ncbi:N-acetylmuramoyl-L-alanine amidase [Lachnospiraceae bacterium JLR.KK008]
MVINVHAGHNPDGKTACGAVGFIRESTEARRVKDETVYQLRRLGHTVYDCTCENGRSQANVLTKIVNACNAHTVDLDVSIHFNSGAKDSEGNGTTSGTEVLIYKKGNAAQKYAKSVADAISALGYRRRSDTTSPEAGVKLRKELYFLNKTKAPAMLVECCFVDDRDDVQLYDCQKMASAIVYGITGKRVADQEEVTEDKEASATDAETAVGDGSKLYRVQIVEQKGAFFVKENAERYCNELKAAGFHAMIVNA